METQILIASEPIKPIDPATYKATSWEQAIFFVLVAPIVLTGVQKIWVLIERKLTKAEEKEKAERQSVDKIVEKSLANKDLFISEFQKQYNVLLQEVISRNDEILKDIQATLATTVGVLATVAENQKAYAEIAMKRSDDTRLILEEIRKASTHTVIESMNSHVKINYISVKNQEKIIALLEKLHDRMDKHFGDDRKIIV